MSNLSVLHMDPENELNLGQWETVLEHWKHFPFWELSGALRAMWESPPGLCLILPFTSVCYISGKELTGLKGWVQLEEKASFSVFEGLREYSCFH